MSDGFINPSLAGTYTGKSHLFLSWLPNPEHVSESTLRATTVGKGTFLLLSYTWSHEGAAHEGTILLGHDPRLGEATAAWMDTWHQSRRLLFCTGKANTAGEVSVQGAYAAPPGPDWGWRITLRGDGRNITELLMHNISPEGVEDLAVQAAYSRAP